MIEYAQCMIGAQYSVEVVHVASCAALGREVAPLMNVHQWTGPDSDDSLA